MQSANPNSSGNPSGATPCFVIAPVGDLNPVFSQTLGPQLAEVFGYPVEVQTLITDVSFAYDPKRDQYHSTPILGQLADCAPPHAVKVLAITAVDLFIPILTYVYGEAQLGGRSCIISTHRLLTEAAAFGEQELMQDRLLKEAIHELGHTFNLRHCKDHSCIMHYCRSTSDVDRKSLQLCRYCQVMLEDEKKRLALVQAPA